MIRRVPSELWHIVAAFAPLAAPLLARASREFWARFRDDPGVWRALLAEALSTSKGMVAVRPRHLELTRRMPALRQVKPALTPLAFSGRGAYNKMALSPDGKRLAYEDKEGVCVADMETGRPLERMADSQGAVALYFTHNALVVVFCNGKCARLTNGHTGSVAIGPSAILGVLYDGTYVTKRDGEVWLHGTDVHAPLSNDLIYIAGDTVALLREDRVDVLRLTGVGRIDVSMYTHTIGLSPSGTMLCAYDSAHIHVFDVLTGVVRHVYKDVHKTIHHPIYVSDGGELCVGVWTYEGVEGITVYDGDSKRRIGVRYLGNMFWVGEALYFTAIQCVTQGFSYECRTFLYKC